MICKNSQIWGCVLEELGDKCHRIRKVNELNSYTKFQLKDIQYRSTSESTDSAQS